ncbi:MAG: hypothetical protein U0670_21910 [Anaerolineae bacterium]
MFKNLDKMSRAQRRFMFFVLFGGALLAFIGISVLLISSSLRSGERVIAQALDPNVSVREFALLSDEKAYPPAVAAGTDGVIVTGSYSTGAMWRISLAGEVTEIPGTRDTIGAFTGITAAPDGSFLIIDQNDTDPRSAGGRLWRLTGDTLTDFPAQIDATGWVAPNDLALDTAGRLYVTDSGRNEVWRFEADGSNGAPWWVPPESSSSSQRRAVTGITYDPLNDAMIITDAEQNMIYRVNVADAVASVIYEHGQRATPPGFDGVTVGPDGTIYVAALGQNGIAIVAPDNTLTYIAGFFRGASDVEYVAPGLLIVPNWDQASIVLPLIAPQLPFSIDVIDLNMPSMTPTPSAT